MLSLEAVDVSYGSVKVVRSINLTVGLGEIVAVTGHNGCGKSTCLKVTCGLVPVDCGVIRWKGSPMSRKGLASLLGNGLAYCPQSKRVFPGLTVRENIELGRLKRTVSGCDDLESKLLDLFPILKLKIDSDAAMLSGGEQQMLSLTRALISKPQLLLLDEPTLGLASIVLDGLLSFLRGFVKEESASVILVEHRRDIINSLASREYFMKAGTIESLR